MPVQPEPERRPSSPLRRAAAVGGVAGGVVALVLAGVGLLTGVVDGHETRGVEENPTAPVSSSGRGLDPNQIYAREAPGVAFIRSYGVSSDTPFGQTQSVAEGSGLVVDRDGDILTNAHVVDGASRVTVRLDGERSTLRARVLGKDDSNDLAVLHVDPGEAKLDPLSLGDSSDVQVGAPVVAIGNPFGLDRTITSGIVSALQRKISGPDGFTIDNVIQTDAAINPGNSGGPLIDANGRVIGINSQIATGSGADANTGIGFAIPINTAKAELPALERGRAVAHPFLGVDAVGSRGAQIRQVVRNSPAAKAGLRAGDVIVSLDARRIAGADALAQAVADHRAGETVTIGYRRDGKRHGARVTLGTRPAA